MAFRRPVAAKHQIRQIYANLAHDVHHDVAPQEREVRPHPVPQHDGPEEREHHTHRNGEGVSCAIERSEEGEDIVDVPKERVFAIQRAVLARVDLIQLFSGQWSRCGSPLLHVTVAWQIKVHRQEGKRQEEPFAWLRSGRISPIPCPRQGAEVNDQRLRWDWTTAMVARRREFGRPMGQGEVRKHP